MGESLKVLKYDFKPKSKFIRIVPLGCLHVGHKNFNLDKALKFIDYIVKTPDTYTMMLGDTCENVLAETAIRHPGSMHEQDMNLEQQREFAIEMIKPLAVKGKVLCWTEGNHSIRSWYSAGFSVEQHLAKELGVPFVGVDALLRLKVGDQIYALHATHGTGAGTSLASVFGKLMAQSQRVEGADVYLRSHHHKKLIADVMQIDAKTGQLKKRLLGATGCFMNYFDSYGHRAGYTPVVQGCIKVKLYDKQWDIHAGL